MTTVPSVVSTAEQVHQLLEEIPNLLVFRGAAGQVPLGKDKTVDAYVVAYYSGGHPFTTRLGAKPRHVAWSAQLTCAGGNDVKALWVVDQVRAALTGVRVTLDARSGLLHELGDPGPIREDRSITPYRYYLPLDFGLNL